MNHGAITPNDRPEDVDDPKSGRGRAAWANKGIAAAADETLCGMKKITVYLDPETDRALDRLAKAQGISKAEVIRRALRGAVQGVERLRVTAIGVGPGPGDVADNVDRHLEETGFGRS